MHELGFPNYGVAALVALALLLAGCGDGDPEPAGEPRAEAVTIEHKFGTTELPADPERVVAVGFNDQDFALALDVHPVGARQFQAGIDITRRPWALDALGDAQPKLIGAEEIDFERVASLRPDVILGVYSGMTDRDYELLSRIAPTVAQTGDHPDYGLPWQDQARLTGRALGRADAARTVVSDVEARFASAREAHPEFAGKRLAMAAGPRDYYVYGPQDLRTRFFTSLGFETPPEVERLRRGRLRRAGQHRAPRPARPGRARHLRRPRAVRPRPRLREAARGPRGPRHLPRRRRRLRERPRLQQPAQPPVRARPRRAAARGGGRRRPGDARRGRPGGPPVAAPYGPVIGRWFNGGMDSSGSSLGKRLLAIVVLIIVAAIALKLAVGFVAGILSFVFWVVVIVALVAAFFWARSTLRSGKRERSVKRASGREVAAPPAEDPVAAEMRRITEQLREQGRG